MATMRNPQWYLWHAQKRNAERFGWPGPVGPEPPAYVSAPDPMPKAQVQDPDLDEGTGQDWYNRTGER